MCLAVLAGVYSAAVMILQKLFVALTGTTSDAAVILSTLLVVASLTPARNLLETIVRRATQGDAGPPESHGHSQESSEVTQALDLAERLLRLEARVAELAGPVNAPLPP